LWLTREEKTLENTRLASLLSDRKELKNYRLKSCEASLDEPSSQQRPSRGPKKKNYVPLEREVSVDSSKAGEELVVGPMNADKKRRKANTRESRNHETKNGQYLGKGGNENGYVPLKEVENSPTA